MNSFLNENTNSCIELDTEHDISFDNSYYTNVNKTIQQIPSNKFAMRLDCIEKSLGVTIRAEIHNHLMDTAVAVFDSGYCKLSNSKNNQVLMLYNSRIPVPIIIRILNKEYKRYIHNKDVYNSLNHQSHDYVKGLSEISQLLSNLHNKTEYLVTYSVKNNKLHYLFFSIHFALMRFENYSKIVLIDSIYKTNYFGMPLFLISDVDAI
ncbi:20658_t:CDS:2, partial [Cetraspora pellucida]